MRVAPFSGSRLPRRLVVVLAAVMLLATSATARTRNPTSKLYVAEVEGFSDIDTGERIEELTKESVYDASSSIIYTRAGSTNAMVFSNGTGVHLDPETTLRIELFVQEPFLPNRADLDVEPSISRMILALPQGRIGLCTSRLVAGSSMEVRTPHGSIQVRGRRIVIESTDTHTLVSLIEGDITVRGGLLDSGGRILTNGQRAWIRPGRHAGVPAEVEVEEIPSDLIREVEDKTALACMARQKVYFDVGDPETEAMRAARGGNSVFDSPDEPVLRPIPVVPSLPDVPTFISPAEIPRPPAGTPARR
jgi:phage baseplate assembly protein gpV